MTDTAVIWQEEWEKEVAEQKTRTSVPPSQWRRTGRASKKYHDEPTKEGPEFWAEQGPKMLNHYVKWRREHQMPIWVTPEGIPAIELEVTVPGFRPGLPPMRGFIDRIFIDTISTGALVVTDLKTGKEPGPRQLGEYKVMIEEQWPGTYVAFGAFWMARAGKMSGLVDLSRYTKEYVAEYIIAPYVRGVQNRVCSPVPSSFCGTCVVRDFCPEVGGHRADEVPNF